MMEAMIKARDMLLASYVPAFYGSEGPSGPQPAHWPIGPEKSLEDLHMPLYRSEQGVLPPVAFFMHDVDTRDWPADSDILQHAEHYALTGESAQFYNRLLVASCRRHGMHEAAVVAAIDAQHKDKAYAGSSGAYLDAEAVIQDIGTYTANAAHYTTDMRYLKQQRGQTLAHLVRSTTDKMTATYILPAWKAEAHTLAVSSHDLAALLCKLTLGKSLAAGAPDATELATAGVQRYELESFDAVLVWGLVNSGDCEDMSNLGSTILRRIPAAAAAATKAGLDLPLLQAAARVCATRIVFDVAASVTGAYVNTEGKELSRDEMKQVTDLPRIGDAMDRRAHVGGHCHGTWEGKVSVAARLTKGGADVAKDLPELHAYCQQAGVWEGRQPTLVLEGTSSIEPWVLPAGEVAQLAGAHDAQAFEARATTRRAFLKHARTAAPALFERFRLEGLSYYTAMPATGDEDRRVSSFYRGLVHLVAPDLYRMNPRYGQVTAVQMTGRTRGIEMGTYLRASATSTDTHDVALIPTFGSISRAQWDTHIRPVMAAVQHQMPLNAFSHFPTPASFNSTMLRNDHVLSSQVLAKLSGSLPLLLSGADLTDTEAVAPVGEMAALCLYTHPWRVGEAAALATLQRELAGLVASGHVVAHTVVHDHPLRASDKVLCLQLQLRVDTTTKTAVAVSGSMKNSLLDASVPVWAY
jgi:hypothetical protein